MDSEDSYKILVDWSKYEHEKMQHFNTVNIAINTLIVTAIGYIIYDKEEWLLPYNLWVLPIFGFLLGLLWLKGLCDIRQEVDFRYEQLRKLEKKFKNKDGKDLEEEKIFTNGYEHFKKQKELKCICKFRGLLTIYQCHVMFFLIVYVIIFLLQILLKK